MMGAVLFGVFRLAAGVVEGVAGAARAVWFVGRVIRELGEPTPEPRFYQVEWQCGPDRHVLWTCTDVSALAAVRSWWAGVSDKSLSQLRLNGFEFSRRLVFDVRSGLGSPEVVRWSDVVAGVR